MHRAPATAAILLALLATTSCRDDALRSQAPSPADHTSSPPPEPALATPLPADPPRRCTAAHTELAVRTSGSTMSQPFADVAVTNTGTTPCLMRGYPRLRAVGHPGYDAAGSARLEIQVDHGVYERPDTGPRPVVVQPGDAALFAVGTALAYQGGAHPITITRLVVTLPHTRVSKTLTVDLVATWPRGQRIPVGVTALRRR